MSNKIIIFTGKIQTGKTTLLQRFCTLKNNVAGILTPIVNGKRVFYNIEGNVFFEMEATDDDEKIAIGKYLFSAAAFAKANTILLTAGKKTGIKYLIIDEIGPLEVKKQQGLYQPLKEIITSHFAYTLILVVRQSLVDEVIAAFNLNNPVVLSLSKMKEYFEL